MFGPEEFTTLKTYLDRQKNKAVALKRHKETGTFFLEVSTDVPSNNKKQIKFTLDPLEAFDNFDYFIHGENINEPIDPN